MTLEQLKALAAVVDHGSFRAAADVLYKSQSSISIAIKKLEDELGLTLFLRDGYRPTLTEEGEALYKKAKSVLSRSDEFSNLAKHLAIGSEPKLRLAMSGIIPVCPIINLLRITSEYAPATQLSLQVENMNGTMERLDDDDADIAITEVFTDQRGYDYRQLIRIEMVTVVACNSPFAESATTLTDKDVEGSTQILVRDTSLRGERMTAGVMESANHWVVNDFMMKKHIIASSLGWGRMPYHMVEESIQKGELVMLTSNDFSPVPVDIKMVRKRNRPMGPVTSKLWKELQQIEWG